MTRERENWSGGGVSSRLRGGGKEERGGKGGLRHQPPSLCYSWGRGGKGFGEKKEKRVNQGAPPLRREGGRGKKEEGGVFSFLPDSSEEEKGRREGKFSLPQPVPTEKEEDK